MIKIYGVKGLMEWVAVIHVGRTAIQVPFTGGTKSGYAISPATYTCRDKVFQRVIEDSDYFKSGKIFLVRSVEESRPAPAKGSGTTPVPTPKEGEGEATDEGAASGGVTTLKVSDRSEAKAYLMEKFGLSANTLRTKADIERYGKVHGIVFEGLE